MSDVETSEPLKEVPDLKEVTNLDWWSSFEWMDILGKLGVWIAIVLVAWIIGGIIAGAMRRAMDRSKKQPSAILKSFFIIWTRRVVVLLGVVIAFGNVGIDIAPLIAGLGVMGFVIGFALQGTLSNFASGVMLLIYQPFDEGDVIETGGIVGKVFGLTVVSTTLLTPDNREVIIPNSSVWGSTIINITRQKTRRIDLVIGVSYDADLKQTQDVLLAYLAEQSDILKDPAPTVEVSELADSSVNFIVRPWVKTEDYWAIRFRSLHEIKDLLDHHGIEIPFPQRVVHAK